GKGVEGPEPREHNYYKVEFVLPFGYWLDRQAWVPIVHVHEELADNERWESVEELKPSASSRTSVSGEVGAARGVIDESVDIALHYARACNYCHTSFPLADMFVRFPKNLGNSIPVKSYFELSDYVAQSHPQIWDGTQPPEQFADAEIQALTGEFIAFDARDQAISLGVGCEACHLGCKAHAQNATSHPAFIPQNPHLLSYTDPDAIDSGRTSENVNAICSRCHAGNRPRYAAGMATWNSTEYTDATRGSCYSELRCTDCHSPHKATGKKWPHSPQHDDDRCLRCHESLREPQRRQRHTHHPAGSTGDHCMNCHMPKINEGMQDVVRTHAIFSPTNPAMIEANQPNACNLCHLDKPIDWTISYLQSWYGRVYAQQMIMQNYPVRAQPVGLGWLKQNHAPTRLVTAQAVADQQATWALPALLQMLDDPYLLNRQFAQVSVERLIGAQLDKRFGYWYYMTEQQRQPIVQSMQKTLGQ
ncbi:MAG: hypothetical protein KDA59_15405, partial [Planctomycetales bacterium]|nr:hypothetical protein [Planctomycetales bacterium]